MAAPQSFSQRIELAEKTRGLFVAETSRVLPELGATVGERLTALMNETGTSREMQSRRDAWLLYQQTQAAWLEGTRRAWQAASRPAAGKTPGLTLDEAGDRLELVGTEEVENKILASRLVLGVTEKVSSQLDDLRLRIRFLEERDELVAHDILRPEVLLLPLVTQWGDSGMPREAWPWIHDAVQGLLAERLQTIYSRCNQFLIEQGVMPTIDFKDRVKRVATAAPVASAAVLPDSAKTATLVPPQPGSGASAGRTSATAHHVSAGIAAGGPVQGLVAAGGMAPVSSGMPAGMPARRGAGLFGGRLGWGAEGAAVSSQTPLHGGPQDETRLLTQDTGTGPGTGGGGTVATHAGHGGRRGV